MNRTLKTVLLGMSLAVCLIATHAKAQEVVVYPPPEFLATTAPVYFEGRPAYWWGGRWYYRNGAAWGFYREEPGFLRDWRGHHEVVRQFYGRDHYVRGGGFRR
jgi:hypothetical protein